MLTTSWCRNGARLRKAGELPRLGGYLTTLILAAMEPAYERRENPARTDRLPSRSRMPQWSPPTKGGRTPDRPRADPEPGRAAMEPAYERRENRWYSAITQATRTRRNGARLRKAGEHLITHWHDVEDAAAAMEPAYERRENGPRRKGTDHEDSAAMEPAYERRENHRLSTTRR